MSIVLRKGRPTALTFDEVDGNFSSLFYSSSISGSLLNLHFYDNTSQSINLNLIPALSASYAATASYVENAQSASYVLQAVSASFANSSLSSSFASSSISSSYALTASYVENAITASYALNSPASTFSSSSLSSSYASSSTSASYALTASYVENAQTASYVLQAVSASFASTVASGLTITASNILVTGTASIVFSQIITSSIAFTSGSNLLGANGSDTQTLWGTIDLKSGPLLISGSTTALNSITAPSFIGPLTGTSSWANNAVTASYILNAVSSSYAATASYVENAITASYALNSPASTFSSSSLSSSYASSSTSASYATNALSASYAPISTNITNNTNNFILTATGGETINGENGLQFDGTRFSVTSSDGRVSTFNDFGQHYIESLAANGAWKKLIIQSNGLDLRAANGATPPALSIASNGNATFNNTVAAPSFTGSFTGSLFGTASFAQNAQSASYVLQAVSASFSQTASYVLNAVSSSFSSTASFVQNAQTASYVLNAVSSSYATFAQNAFLATTASYTLYTSLADAALYAQEALFATSSLSSSWASSSISSSYASSSTSASYALSSSYATNALSSSYAISASFASSSISASYATNALSSSFASSSISSSYADFAQNADTANSAGTAGFATSATIATNATDATNATNTAVTDTTTGVGPYYVTFVTGTTGNQAQLVDSNALTFNADTNTLTVTSSFATSASFAQNATTASFALSVVGGTFPFTGSAIISGSLTNIGNTILSGSTIVQSSSLTVATGSLIVNLPYDGVDNTTVATTIDRGSNLIPALSVTGSSNFNGPLTVDVGTFTAKNNLIVSGSSTFINGTVTVRSGLTVTGSTLITGSTTIIGNTTITGSLRVSGSITGSLQGTSSWATRAITASNISPAVTNNTSSYILTATGGGSINGNSSLTFDGTSLINAAGGGIIKISDTLTTPTAGITSFVEYTNLPTSLAQYYGETISGTAQASLSRGQIIYLSPSNAWGPADCTNSSINNLLGICLNNAGASDPITILLQGFVVTDQFSSFASYQQGLPLYLSTAGQITDAAPGTTQNRIIGHYYREIIPGTYSIRFNPDNYWA
jgi:cytoskeletal protein CcmA (bactofilin family)